LLETKNYGNKNNDSTTNYHDRISFLREQIDLNNNKSEVNSTFQIQIDAIRAVEDYSFEKVFIPSH
jgi:hypothetical protein